MRTNAIMIRLFLITTVFASVAASTHKVGAALDPAVASGSSFANQRNERLTWSSTTRNVRTSRRSSRQLRRRRTAKDDKEDEEEDRERNNDNDDQQRSTKAPTTKSPTTKAPNTPSPWIAVPSTRVPVVAPTATPVVSPTRGPVVSPTKVPVVSPTKVPVAAPTNVPVVAPTKNPVAAPVVAPVSNAPVTAPAPTEAPFQFVPSTIEEEEDAKKQPPVTLAPTFNNKRETRSVSLLDFEVEVTADDTLDEQVMRDDIRKAAQIYLKDYMEFDNLLFVQLHTVERRVLVERSGTFRYEGEAVFSETAPEREDILERQMQALQDATTFQAFLATMWTLQDVKLVGATTLQDELRADADKTSSSNNTVIVIAIAVGVALAMGVCILVMVCKLCRRKQPPPPPMDSKEDYNPHGEGTHASDTDDEKNSDDAKQIPNIGSGETVEAGTFSSDADDAKPEQPKKTKNTLQGILSKTKKRVPEHMYSIPMIERTDSADSMDGYSLGSKPKANTKPSWLNPSPAAGDYTSDSESQFSYDNIPGTNLPRVLGRTLSSDSLETTDDELAPAAAAASPMSTKGYQARTEEEHDSLSGPDTSNDRRTLEEDAGSLPFDESIEDSMEQDLDVFTAELEKIKRDIATRRVNEENTRR